MTTMVSTPINVNDVFSALETFIRQRPGLDPRNYGCDTADGRSAYQSELRQIGKDRQRAMKALDEARGLVPARPDLLADAFKRAFSGRLEWKPSQHCTKTCMQCRGTASSPLDCKYCKGTGVEADTTAGRLEYCTGQYWPTEYRKAAASVLETYVATWRQVQNAGTPQTFTYHTIADVKAANRAIGNHWFDRSSMRFFNTRIESGLIGGKYFITSERMDENHPRKYTVRKADPDGSISDLGDFQQYSSVDAARQAIRILGK